MYGLENMRRLEKEDFDFVFEPILRNSKELLELPLPDNLEELAIKHNIGTIDKYGKEATRIYQIVPTLIGIQDIVEGYTNAKGIDENDESVSNLLDRIERFAKENLLLKIQTAGARLKISPDFKLMMTPLGITLMHCYLSQSSETAVELKDILIHANELLGTAFNSFVIDRVSYYLEQTRSLFNKKEIVLSIFLLLSQATSRERAIRLGRPANGNLLEPLQYIANGLFPEEPELFSKASTVEGAIRRSTGASGLEGKTSMLFVKDELEDKTGYLVYYNLDETKRANSLLLLVSKLLKSIKAFEENENKPYRERTLRLVDNHVGNRNLVFRSKPYIREKLLKQPNINTSYLENLYRMMNHLD